MSEVKEIANGIYRLSTYESSYPVAYVQFLIKDERPLLFHTGPRAHFRDTLEAVKRIVDPATLRYISWSHLEADECGALNDFLQAAPEAEPVHGEVAVFLSVADFFVRPVRAMKDSETLDLGSRKLRFLITPHVPHSWDSIIAYEETTGTLLCSDLFAQLGKPVSLTNSDIVEPAIAAYKQFPDYLPLGQHTARVLNRLEALRPKVLAGHHSPAYNGDAPRALRELREGLLAGAPKA